MSSLYAYIDESGDEGFPPGDHRDASLYRDRSTGATGPSPFFMMCGAVVEIEKRSVVGAAVRALAARLHPTDPDREIHWRKLDFEKKQYAAQVCGRLEFEWFAAVAYKPAIPKRLDPPDLYNYCTRLLIERLCIHADHRRTTVVPVFSNRSRTNYAELQQYLIDNVDAFGTAHRLGRLRISYPARQRRASRPDRQRPGSVPV